MRKISELNQEKSCLNKAGLHEQIFVLLARDAAAPATIRAWVAERIRLGKNTAGDAQTCDALACARLMERERGPL